MGDDRTIGDVLAEKAVLLRIDAGSQESGFLSAFCAVDRAPKLIIIRYVGVHTSVIPTDTRFRNGSVLEDIEPGISREEWMMRITSCVEQSTIAQTSSQPVHQPTVPPAGESAVPTSSSDPDRVQSLLAERAARLEKNKLEKEKAEREARKVIAKARKEEAEKAAASEAQVPSSRQNYLEQQRTRQLEAKQDKERVLRMIEGDKAARRERETQRRMLSQGGIAEAGPSSSANPRPTQSNSARSSDVCSLQIRLFDGSSLRGKFSSDATLTSSVRTYITEQSQTHQPYNFRLMQVPGPSRTIDISEENETLQALGLCPSATLVLVPVKDYTDAYSGAYSGGVIERGVAMGSSLAYGAYGLVTGTLGRLTGYGNDGSLESDGPYVAGIGDEKEPSNVQGGRMADRSRQAPAAAGPSSSSDTIKVRTLADQRREDKDAQFYNGNQVSGFVADRFPNHIVDTY